MTKEQVIAKVRKLIALANNAGATEGERDNAMRMAHKFLAKHNLEMAELGDANQENRIDTVLEFRNYPASRRIANAIAKLYFCNYLYFKGTNRHLMVGEEANVVTATEMAMFVITTVRAAAGKHARATGGGNSAKTAYQHGAADTIAYRVEEIIAASRNQTAESGSRALVLADVYATEKEKNDKFIADQYGKSKASKARKRKPLDRRAYEQGVAKGQSINLNTQLR